MNIRHIYKTTILLFVIISTGCTSSKFYRYTPGSLIVNPDVSDSRTVKHDSLQIVDIKPGYYFKRIPADTTFDRIDYNEIDWIYISKDNKVKLFLTANFEYCMQTMWWKDEPKEIYKQIKRNKKKFNEFYLECEIQEFVPSSLKKNNEAIIVLNPKDGDIINSEELIFIKDGLIRKIRNYERIISMDEYKFISK